MKNAFCLLIAVAGYALAKAVEPKPVTVEEVRAVKRDLLVVIQAQGYRQIRPDTAVCRGTR